MNENSYSSPSSYSLLSGVLALLASACGGPEGAGEVEAVGSAVLTPQLPSPWVGGSIESTTTLTAACPTTRWIGYITSPTIVACPAAPAGWTVAKLFTGGANAGWAPELDRFCRYTWVGAGTPTAANIAALPAVSGATTQRLERDCRVVVQLGAPNASAGGRLASAHASALNLPTFGNAAVAPATRTRIAVIDNAPTEFVTGLPSGTGHGLAVAALARRAGCMGSGNLGCPFVVNHRGLAEDGGNFGYQSDVAIAIVQAMRRFRSDNTQTNLVINLSLGWDPSYGNAFGDSKRVSAYAVYVPLQVAACQDYLVVAAAGNRARVDQGTGPMLPAGWEGAPRVCQPTLNYAPLVHAIGGLTPDDEPMSLSRLVARPPLAAPASLATTVLGNGAYTDVLSGSSVAAASVAGIASLVWSLEPTLKPEQLMARLYDNAVPLGAQADFENPIWSMDVRRVDACAAVAAVANGVNEPNTCSPRAAGVAVLPSRASVMAAQVPGFGTMSPTPGLQIRSSGFVPQLAPDVNFTPWAGPQPTKPPCPLCFVFEDGFDQPRLDGILDYAGTMDTLYVRFCIGPCDDMDPSFEVTGSLASGTVLKVPLPEYDLNDVTSARLEAKIVRPDGNQVYNASEIQLHP